MDEVSELEGQVEKSFFWEWGELLQMLLKNWNNIESEFSDFIC